MAPSTIDHETHILTLALGVAIRFRRCGLRFRLASVMPIVIWTSRPCRRQWLQHRCRCRPRQRRCSSRSCRPRRCCPPRTGTVVNVGIGPLRLVATHRRCRPDLSPCGPGSICGAHSWLPLPTAFHVTLIWEVPSSVVSSTALRPVGVANRSPVAVAAKVVALFGADQALWPLTFADRT